MKSKSWVIKASVLMLCAMLLINCKKNADTVAPANIIGKWNWIETYFDYQLSDSNPLTPANTHRTETMIFNSDHTFKTIINNITTDSGTYSTGHGSSTNLSNYTSIYDSVVLYNKGISETPGYANTYNIFSGDTLGITFYALSSGEILSGGNVIFFVKQ